MLKTVLILRTIYRFENLRFAQVFKNISLSTKPEVNHSVYGRLQADSNMIEFKSNRHLNKIFMCVLLFALNHCLGFPRSLLYSHFGIKIIMY
jgi:hypothetical protein